MRRIRHILAQCARWWRRRRLRRYGVRPATERDTVFIHELIIQGIQEGHFSVSLLLPDPACAKQRFTEVIRNERTVVLWNPEFGFVTCRSRLLIWCAPQHDQVGFSYLMFNGGTASSS